MASVRLLVLGMTLRGLARNPREESHMNNQLVLYARCRPFCQGVAVQLP